MTTPQAPLPKRRPLRTREELLQAGRRRAGGMRPAPELTERLAALLMVAFPAKPSGTGPLDNSASKEAPASWLKPGPVKCHPALQADHCVLRPHTPHMMPPLTQAKLQDPALSSFTLRDGHSAL